MALGFALIALEWFRSCPERLSKVTLVARNMERELQRQIKDALGSVGVAEVEVYEDDAALAGMARHAYEIDQDRFRKTHARLFFAGVVAFIWHGSAASRGWPGCCTFRGIIPQSLG